MKKWFALLLALLMALFCAACSNTASEDNSLDVDKQKTAEEGTADTSENTSKLVLVPAESGQGFPCALLDNGEVFWVKGVQSPSEIASRNSLKDAPMALIEVVDDEIRIVGDEIPDWLEEEEERFVQIVLDAMEEWEAAPEEANLGSVALEVKGPTAITDEITDEDLVFACLVLDNGNVTWEKGVFLPSELKGHGGTPVQVVGLPNGSWDLRVIGEIPEWFNDSIVASVSQALGEWLDSDSGDGGSESGPAPTNAEEAVGVYTFGTTNSYGNSVSYALKLNADGTAIIYYNGFMGVETNTAEEWTFGEDGVVSVGPATGEDGGSPSGAVFDIAEDHSTEWVLNGDGTCVPNDWTGAVSAVAADAFPDEVYEIG